MVQIDSLSKKFNTNVIFDNVSLHLQADRLYYLYGPNGSGKSTFFKLICGILQADSGSITIPSDVNIGAVIENTGFLESESLLYNLRYLYQLKGDYDQEVVKQLCQLFDLDLFDKKAIKTYSVGMRQKAAIIQAVMEGQNCILLDEPLRGLDTAAIQSFIELIHQLRSEHKMIVIAAHDAESIFQYDSFLKIEDQRIVECASYEKII